MRSSLVKPLRTRLGVATVVIAALFAALAPALLRAADSQEGQKTDLKVLLMTHSTSDSMYESWRDTLDQEGIPYATFNAASQSLTASTLADGTHAKYQAVVVTTGNMTDPDYPTAGSPYLDATEPTALSDYEESFGIRQITDGLGSSWNVHGINAVENTWGTQAAQTGNLTAFGKTLFPELKGPVPIPAEYGFQVTAQTGYQTIVTGSNGSPYLGLYTDPTTQVEEMVSNVTSTTAEKYSQLLRRGMLRWATRGVHLGSARTYFSAHIDDVFLPNTMWSTTLHCTPGNDAEATCPPGVNDANVKMVRMNTDDTAAAIAWQNAHGIKFDFAFNGWGYRRDFVSGEPTGVADPLADDPAKGLLVPEVRDQFRWINHTWSHEKLDALPLNVPAGPNPDPDMTLNAQIGNNITFAQQHGIPIEADELVTGEHSGLGSYKDFTFPDGTVGAAMNPNMPAALTQNGIKWTGDDASSPFGAAQRVIGSATTVPRHPSNVYYNVYTREDQLNEYNWVYLDKNVDPANGNCVNTATTTCRTTPATWADYVASESGIMFGHLAGNDPRPHYMHQPNLITAQNGGKGILFGTDGQGVLDDLFGEYDTYFNRSVAPITNPRESAAGLALKQQIAWAAAKNSVTAYIENGKVTITTSGSVDVPVTGTTVGDVDSDARSGWTTVSGTTTLDVTPLTAPTVSGSPVIGQTLTATAGRWGSGRSAGSAWVRCDAQGANCAPIAGATALTYQVGAADLGQSIRYRETGLWTRAIAQTAQLVFLNVTVPTLVGTPQPGSTLTATPAVWGGTVTSTGQWLRCDTTGEACQAITPAGGNPNGTSYVVQVGDVAATIRYAETEQNSQFVARSLPVTIVPVPVGLTTAPKVTGSTTVGSQLTATPGVWTGSPTIAAQWVRCTGADVTTCQEIAGQTGATYTTTQDDVGKSIRYRETEAGQPTVPAYSNGITVKAVAITNTAPPSISGDSVEGSTLTATPGAWTGQANVAGQWVRCDSAAEASCSEIAGATGLTYVTTSADVGKMIRYREKEATTPTPAFSGPITVSAAPATTPPTDPTGPTGPAGPTGPSGPTTPPQARITSFTLAPAKFFPSKKAKDAKVARRRTVATWNMTAAAKVTLSIQRKTTAKVKVKVKVKGKTVTKTTTVVRWVTFQNVAISAKKGKNSYTFSGLAKGKRIAAGPGRMQIWTTGAKGAKIDLRTTAFTALTK